MSKPVLSDSGPFAPALYDWARGAVARSGIPALSDELAARRPTALSAVLGRSSSPSIDAEGEAVQQNVLHAAVATNLFLLTSVAPVAWGLEKSRVRWAALKGLDHLARLYPGLEWREMTDVDLQVHPEDLAAADDVLAAEGFEPLLRTPAVQPGRCFSKGLATIDLHRRLVRRGGFVEDLDWLLHQTSLAQVEGCPVRLMAPPQALAAHALLLAKDYFSSAMVRAERVVELGLLADGAGAAGEAEAWSRLEGWGAGRVARCSRDVVDWLRGGPHPGWAEQGFGGPEAGFGKPPALARRLARGAWLQGSARNAAPWILAQAWSFAVQRLSGRRWASWEAKA